jgi:alkylhydroperoxidase family enzyme
MFRPVLGICLLLIGVPVVAADPVPRLPLLTQDEAWKKLPDAPAKAEPLPAWARAMAGWQPVTTARMLELDAMHRSGDRLDARFRAVVRYAAADANRCEYTKAMAASDYARAAGATADLPAVMKTPDKLPEVDRLGAAFARKMMLEASKVTDAEVKMLIALIGDERTVAVVALVAHASFQDRVLLALNVSPEAGGVPAPVTAKFGRPKPAAHAPPPTPPATDKPVDKVEATDGWLKSRQAMDAQKKRPGRIAVPTDEWVTKRMGQGHPALWQNGIIWSRVCYGHQPELTDAWFDTATAFRQEAHMDGTFGNGIFWTVTDALDCFY